MYRTYVCLGWMNEKDVEETLIKHFDKTLINSGVAQAIFGEE